MSTNGHRPDCDGCIPCQEDTCLEVAYCVNERPTGNLCDHHVDAVCPDHWPGQCRDCRAEAEQEMFDTGVYNPQADPLYDACAAARSTYADDMRNYLEQSGYDPATNTHRRRA